MTFATAVPISFTSFVYGTNVFWSVIHGIKRKPHLLVIWNWYHFVAIAILHPHPTDSADINTRLQLSDTSSIPQMHGGFLLVYHFIAICEFILELQSRNTQFRSKSDDFFVPCDLEIWQMTLKNSRAPLLYQFKLHASFHSHLWIQTGLTVRKRPHWGKNFFWLLWPWPLTSDLDLLYGHHFCQW